MTLASLASNDNGDDVRLIDGDDDGANVDGQGANEVDGATDDDNDKEAQPSMLAMLYGDFVTMDLEFDVEDDDL